jgi:hypothetical protein
MSDLAGLTVISFLGAIAFFLFYYTSKISNDMGDQIVTGFIGNNPISMKQRWLMLYSTWVSYVIGEVAMGVFLAVASLRIADHVADPGVRDLAYLGAMLAGAGAIMWLLQGVLTFVNYRSVLRQAELD